MEKVENEKKIKDLEKRLRVIEENIKFVFKSYDDDTHFHEIILGVENFEPKVPKDHKIKKCKIRKKN